MFKCAIIQSMSDCSIKEDLIKIKELKLISKIENSPLLVLLGYYPEDDLSGAGNIVKGGLGEEYSLLLDLASGIARGHSVYFSPGVLLEEEGGAFYFSSFLFNPDGEIILKQQQLYPAGKVKSSGPGDDMGEPGGNCIKAAKTINYAETELGKIGLISGRDCWHPEIGRVMALEKVEIVLAVNRMGFNESFPANCWQQMAGIWSQVQQNQFIALEASLGGQNLVHGPCEITPYRTGILAPVGKEENARKKSIEPYFEDISGVYSEVDGFKVITAEIDINGLKRIQSSYPLLKHLNPSLYCKEMRGWRRI